MLLTCVVSAACFAFSSLRFDRHCESEQKCIPVQGMQQHHTDLTRSASADAHTNDATERVAHSGSPRRLLFFSLFVQSTFPTRASCCSRSSWLVTLLPACTLRHRPPSKTPGARQTASDLLATVPDHFSSLLPFVLRSLLLSYLLPLRVASAQSIIFTASLFEHPSAFAWL